MIPLLFWCVDAGLGARFLFVVVGGDALGGLVKLAFHAPRPYWIGGQVKALAVEPSYGVPSTHALVSMAAWLLLARQVGRGWAWAVAALLILAIALSRLYLGVHFPHDVLAGWLIGLVALAVFWRAEPRAVAWLKSLPATGRYLVALILPAAVLLLWAGFNARLAGLADPPEWERQAAQAAPPEAGGRVSEPRRAEAFFTDAGVLLGAGLALAWAHGRWRFHAGGPLWQRAARFAVGIAGLLALQIGLGAIFPDEPAALGLGLRVLRYGAIGFWAAGGAPWLFMRLRLADSISG
jgi:hypothetical protein